jgi:hypothetical protein
MKPEVERPAGQAGTLDMPKTANWHFKFRNYSYILPMKDPARQKTPSGVEPNLVLRVREWRVVLDLVDELSVKIDACLRKSDRLGLDFWEVRDLKKADRITDRAETLRKLVEMDVSQLMSLLTAQEMEEAGLMPGSADKMQLVMAIIDSKKLMQ